MVKIKGQRKGEKSVQNQMRVDKGEAFFCSTKEEPI